MSLAHSPEATPQFRRTDVSAADHLMTIGDVAKEFNVTLRALRFYEDRGLLAPLRDAHARFYTARDRTRLARILEGKRLGFTLNEIREFLEKGTDSDNRATLLLKPDQIKSQITHLERQRASIDKAIGQLSEALKA